MKYLAIFILTIILTIGGCSIISSDCDDVNDSYYISDFNRSLKSITYNTENDINYTLNEITEDEISSEKYAIYIDPVENYYNSRASNKLRIGGPSIAFACSPKVPTTDGLIEDIIITSDEDFNEEFPADSDLTEIFDIISFREGQANQIQSLSEFLESPKMVPNEIILVLNQAPDSTTNLSFWVALELKNIGYRYFSFKTKYVSVVPSE